MVHNGRIDNNQSGYPKIFAYRLASRSYKKNKVNASLGRHGYWSNEFSTKDHEIGFEDHDQTLKSERPLVNFH